MVSTQGNRTQSAVEDSGPGIPPEERPSCSTGSTGSTDDGSGTGLGLAIADSIVRSTGGRWNVTDAVLGGAHFEVSWHRSHVRDVGPEVRPAGRSRHLGHVSSRPPTQTGDGLANAHSRIRAWEGTRTPDLRITNALLYQLSYPGDDRSNYPTHIGPRRPASARSPGQAVTAERRTSIASSSNDSFGFRMSSAADRSTTVMAAASSRTRSAVRPDHADGTVSGSHHGHQPVTVGRGQHGETGAQLVGPPPTLLAVLTVFDLLAPGHGALAALLGVGAELLHLDPVTGSQRFDGLFGRGQQFRGQRRGRRSGAVEA